VDDHPSVFEVARALWRANWKGEPLRLLGITVSGLVERGDGEQTELFTKDDRARTLLKALDRVRDRLGEASVVPAGSLTHRRELGHIPFGAVQGAEARKIARKKEREPKRPEAPDPGEG
jgi:hypothetical protein